MSSRRATIARTALGAATLLLLASSAEAGTVNVANDGVDGAACGAKTAPCRSITRGIANAAPGDKVVVGPGRYGDLNSNGVLSGAGEEIPTAGCGCMLTVNKAVKLTSSRGAAATVIDARTVAVGKNVLIATNGGAFGAPAKGFMVTNSSGGSGIVLDATDVSVRGNQVVSDGNGTFGIETVDGPGLIRIEANQVIGPWNSGIRALGGGKTVRRNAVSLAGRGIESFGSNAIEGNVVTANGDGLSLNGQGAVVGNAAVGNRSSGVFATTTNGLSLERNNFFGNAGCGVSYNAVIVGALLAQKNYWGAATGPGPDPADFSCNGPSSSTTVTPFATKAFNVKAPIKP
jgi:Periplasmic copper-binding protein (NosD)